MNIKTQKIIYRFYSYLDPNSTYTPFTLKEDKLIYELLSKNKWDWKN